MKRAFLCFFALLLAACAKPEAKPTAEQPSYASERTSPSEPRKMPETADTAKTVPVETSDGAGAAASALPEPEERFPGKFSDEPVYGERSYKSSSIDVTVSAYTVKDTYAKITSYYVADIYVKDVTSIKAAAARGDFNTRYVGTVREISDGVGALLAIDGDTYTHERDSFVIRNGVLYRSTLIEDTDLCVLYRDGRMETKKWGTFTMQEIIDADPWQVWGFGPALLDENGHAIEISHQLQSHNPRAAIGYYEPGHYCFVIVDGRQPGWSEGVKLTALSRLMEDLGCKAAYNLDGGASAQMYWNGDIISKSCDEGRKISDIIYILPEE
ncbi:MAG: phosphodiester glycosidase family protein [Clostridia bacterium]|nr:phosphodiester glycosidase family protein [Clostridia bacterium]